MKEMMSLKLDDVKPVEMSGNGLKGNGIDCSMEKTDFDAYLKEMEF